jgi:hypothetical protein
MIGSNKKLLQAAAGNAGGGNLYVEDVFSTYLYTGNSSTQTITNGIDLDGEGGMVWIKGRSASYSHYLFDTERGFTAGDDGNFISSNNTNAESSTGNFGVSAFNSNGFSLHGSWNGANNSPETFASWTFRKAEKFFDVVTYTGDGSVQNIAHNLGSSVGTLIVKRTDSTSNWWTWHKDIGTNYLSLNTTGSQAGGIVWNYTAPTDSVFTVGDDANTNSATYVAYLFASDAGGFGDDGSESIIKCGSYSGAGTVDLGFEPQFVLYKRTESTGPWYLQDTMRGLAVDGSNQAFLYPSNSNAEGVGTGDLITPTSTGFNHINAGNYIYIAIRRPMKTPESGTEVFSVDQGDTTSTPAFNSGFVTDFNFYRNVNSGSDFFTSSRLTGNKYLATNSTAAESSSSSFTWDFMDGFREGTLSTNFYSWMFKRATGFFDVVAYTGDGVAGSTQSHNLGVVPEFMVIKQRSGANNWICGGTILGTDGWMFLNNTNARDTQPAYWNNTLPTATQFTVGSATAVNETSETYISYLFATLDGVSKVGSYTGTGADLNVNCGFSAGARFILIKRYDSTGDWYVWDSERGIVASNDPYLLLNSTAAQVTSTDYIDPLSSGFTVTSSAPAALNASGGTYIFLAIA